MQELAGRLTALDPEASASLKVIAYFDALIANGAGLESIVRAATILSGVAAGAEASGKRIRVDAAGRRADDAQPGAAGPWPTSVAGGRLAWLERDGEAHANDAMILDRLSLSVSIVDGRGPAAEAGALEVVLDAARSAEERAAALSRLRLDAHGALRVTALPAEAVELPPGRSVVVALPAGLVRAVVSAVDAVPQVGPAGHAVAADPHRLPEAWADARIALRLADRRHPVFSAADLGAFIGLARAFDPAEPHHPDVDALLALDERTREMLDQLVEAESVRAAATALGLHHSSLQTRHETLTRQLGYDPRSAMGRSRYEAARLLSRLV